MKKIEKLSVETIDKAIKVLEELENIEYEIGNGITIQDVKDTDNRVQDCLDEIKDSLYW